MTLKNSFLVDLRENNKRRTLLWVISWLLFLLYYIVGIMLTISVEKSYLASVEYFSDAERAQQLAIEVTNFLMSTNWLLFVTIAISVLCAVQGFEYLYNLNQLDFFHSLPVKATRRFLYTWLNGISIFLLPSLVSLVGAVLIAAAQGIITGAMVATLVHRYLLTFALYITIYHFNIIAVMLTGSMGITTIGIIFLQGYEAMLITLRMLYLNNFGGAPVRDFPGDMPFTPYYMYSVAAKDGIVSDIWATIRWFAILSLLFMGIAYLLYLKRPSEAAGHPIAFKRSEPVVKIAIAVPASLFMAVMFKMATSFESNGNNGNPWLIGLALVLTSVLACAMLQAIFEFDVKAALNKKHHILISLGLSILIFFLFRFNILK
jgi:ABC-2 type transport system permease protein